MKLHSLALPLLATLAPTPQGKPGDDAKSPETLVGAVYATISGPAGETRDWDRFRQLFHGGARLTVVEGPDDAPTSNTLTVDEFIETKGAEFTKRGFFETVKENKAESAGAIGQSFATTEFHWESPEGQGGESAVGAQFIHDGKRWWITSMIWQRPSLEAPEVVITAEARARAQQIFRTACFTCHGLGGKGDGPAAIAINPKPRDYTDPEWQKTITDEEIRSAILDGVKREDGKPSMMLPQSPHFVRAPEGTIDAMVELIRNFARQ